MVGEVAHLENDVAHLENDVAHLTDSAAQAVKLHALPVHSDDNLDQIVDVHVVGQLENESVPASARTTAELVAGSFVLGVDFALIQYRPVQFVYWIAQSVDSLDGCEHCVPVHVD